jgi:acetyl-CoA acetyltransferase family protein
MQALGELAPADFLLPVRGWANRVSGRSMGEHTEDTAKAFGIGREAQDALALRSHANAAAAQDRGFFADLVLPIGAVDRDQMVRRDSSMERLASLKTAFDRSERGTITAGNASPLTDGAASVWIADREGLERLGAPPAVRLLDWRIAAMDYPEEGILMAPARAIPRLLAAHGLRFEDIALWELHEAFAAQVLANIKAASDPAYRMAKAGVDADLGPFPMERLSPNGGTLALGHPFGATGARLLSQTAKELLTRPAGARAVVSVCADGGQGVVALLEHASR